MCTLVDQGPGDGGRRGGVARWIALDLDRTEWEDLAPVLEEWWEKGLYAYPSRGLTRGGGSGFGSPAP